MAPEGKEKKRKAMALPSEASQKPLKKSKRLLENNEGSAASVLAAEAITTDGSQTATKSKHKPRKRAADFLSDAEDNAANSAPVLEREGALEATKKPKRKASEKSTETSRETSNLTNALLPVTAPAEVKRSKKQKNVSNFSSDLMTSSSATQSVKTLEEQRNPATSGTPTAQEHHTMHTQLPAPSKMSKKNKKAHGQASKMAEALTADGINGVAELVDDEALQPLTNKDVAAASMQWEGQATAEKELEEEWGTEEEEDDQGGAFLAGFDSDGEDNAEDVGLEAGKPMPKLPKKTSKKAKNAAQESATVEPGVVYVGRIPHGFYEQQMREYFSQFGTITKIRLSRNRRTGASKHFAFIEFESNEVAKIVANTMDNYLMFGHILKCKYAPKESLHPALWKGANKRFRMVPFAMLEKKALEAPKTSQQWERKNAKEQKRREQKAEKMKELGYEIKLPKLKKPQEVLEQRELQKREQQTRLKAVEETHDAPVEAIEPSKSLPKEELAMKAEKKSKKNNHQAKMQSVKSLTATIPAAQPAESALVESHQGTVKRDKRKEKKAKMKEEKIQQSQLDSQLIGDAEAAVKEADAAVNPVTSSTVEAKSAPNKNDKSGASALKALENEKEKGKRRKDKDSKVGTGETGKYVTKTSGEAERVAVKPEKKKRKSGERRGAQCDP